MEEEWDYLCSELGILEDKEKQDLIKRFIKHSNERVLELHKKIFLEELAKRVGGTLKAE